MPLLSYKLTGFLRLSDSRLSKMKQSLHFMFLIRLAFMFSFLAAACLGVKKNTICGIVDRWNQFLRWDFESKGIKNCSLKIIFNQRLMLVYLLHIEYHHYLFAFCLETKCVSLVGIPWKSFDTRLFFFFKSETAVLSASWIGPWKT